MKKILIPIIMLAFAFITPGLAQQNGQVQDSTLRTKNIPVPSTTSAPQIEDAKAKSDSEIQAEKNAKDKGKTHKQTEVRPDEIIPPVKDTLRIEPRPR